MNWETVIGLEVHAQLNTKSKLFSGASTAYGASPNAHTSFVDAGLPGVLPVLNKEAVKKALQFGLAINAEINNHSYFERKNYFYPDLPKGYQISQFVRPIVGEGTLDVTLSDGSTKAVSIVRAHLEEDAGKSVHDAHPTFTGVDLNRAGTPLLEIVTSPCMYSAQEAIAYLKTLHQLVRFIGICDGNMQEGSFRCDVNISLRPAGSETLGTRTELKNLNSFKFIEKAISYEQAKHQDCLESGKTIIQETRLYSPDTNTTHSMRSKESENDYRYFPDPDLLPIFVSDAWLTSIKDTLPKPPSDIKAELQQHADLKEDDISFILATLETVSYFYSVKEQSSASAKQIANWMKGPYAAALNEAGLSFEHPPIDANILGDLLSRVTSNKLSSNHAKTVFSKLLAGEGALGDIIASGGFESSFDQEQLIAIIEKTITSNPKQAEDYKNGKTKLLGFFVGQVMKQTKGQANPADVSRLVEERLR
jgi:aspartyl-tRNA(Asn)/glutamyl-tRNA(Gln) amidotransferase subunit B